MLTPILTSIPLQLLAYYVAVTRGLQRGPAAQPGQVGDGGISPGAVAAKNTRSRGRILAEPATR